jgi:hypothetical protein
MRLLLEGVRVSRLMPVQPAPHRESLEPRQS